MLLTIDQIIPDPNQPRKTFDKQAIKELASSFEHYGIISPLKVRPCGDNRYMIITGEMRWRAAKEKRDKEIEVGTPIDVTDQQAREMQFIENLHRLDVPPLELGKAFYNHRKKYTLTQEQLATIIGLRHNTIAKYESIHNNLSRRGKKYLKLGRLDFTSAAAIATIEDQAKQTELVDIAVAVGKELTGKTIAKIASMINAQQDRPVADIVDDVITGKAKEDEAARLEAAKRAAGITLETPEALMRGAEALIKEAKRKAKEAMTPEKKTVLEAKKKAEAETKAEAKRLKDEERRRIKAEENQKREERAEKKARTKLFENPAFIKEVLDKTPTELIEEKLEERLYTLKDREIISKPSKPTTVMDKFYELEKMANNLSDVLVQLQDFPAFGKAVLGMALKTLRQRIDEVLERMGIELIEAEAKLIKEGE